MAVAVTVEVATMAVEVAVPVVVAVMPVTVPVVMVMTMPVLVTVMPMLVTMVHDTVHATVTADPLAATAAHAAAVRTGFGDRGDKRGEADEGRRGESEECSALEHDWGSLGLGGKGNCIFVGSRAPPVQANAPGVMRITK